MTVLGLAFLLALGGLFILDHLSYGLALAAILSIAFVASYLAEKRLDILATAGHQTEIVLSFSGEELVPEKSEKALDNSETNGGVIDLESAVTLDELPILEEIDQPQQTTEKPVVETINEINKMKSQDAEILDIEIEELIIEDERKLEIIEPLQELDLKHQLTELTDDEFAFLTETRELTEEVVTDLPEATDIPNEDIFLQRSALLEELDEPSVVSEEVFVPELIDEVSSEESMKTELYNETLISNDEPPATEEVHLVDEPISIEESSPVDKSEQVKSILEEVEVTDTADVIEELEEIDEAEVLKEELKEVQISEEFETEVREHEVEEVKAVSYVPDMDGDVQDMLLSTLVSYQEQGDHESYQVMAATVLNQSLSDKDYYLFSKLLLDSYAVSNEFTRFSNLLDAMETRLQSYPIISEELQKYKDIYLDNN